MLCGPPETLMNRTVLPGAIWSVLGPNAARLVPLPVIFPSTTGPPPVGAAGGGVAVVCAVEVCAACAWSAFFSPHAMAPSATITPSAVNRIASVLRGIEIGCACERVHNIPRTLRNGRPGSCALVFRVETPRLRPASLRVPQPSLIHEVVSCADWLQSQP